ncbi:MAG: hypothetical protein LBC31_09480 [Treponema sp.]|jgi:hypothetical protein|nr:hypothetical protein [Treponema sp.]
MAGGVIMDDRENLEYHGRPLVFYYSREKRLERASPAVREMNDSSPPRKPGLFRTLTSTRPLSLLFVSVVTLCAAVILLSRFSGGGGAAVLGNNTVRVSAVTAGEKAYVTVKKNVRNDGAYTGPADTAVSLPVQGETTPPVYVERIYFTLEREETFRFSVPFTGKKLLVLMEAGEDRALFTINPD